MRYFGAEGGEVGLERCVGEGFGSVVRGVERGREGGNKVEERGRLVWGNGPEVWMRRWALNRVEEKG